MLYVIIKSGTSDDISPRFLISEDTYDSAYNSLKSRGINKYAKIATGKEERRSLRSVCRANLRDRDPSGAGCLKFQTIEGGSLKKTESGADSARNSISNE